MTDGPPPERWRERVARCGSEPPVGYSIRTGLGNDQLSSLTT